LVLATGVGGIVKREKALRQMIVGVTPGAGTKSRVAGMFLAEKVERDPET
jgi:hypothetical protein